MPQMNMSKMLLYLCVAWSSSVDVSGAVLPADASAIYRRAAMIKSAAPRYWNQSPDTYGYVDRRPIAAGSVAVRPAAGDLVFGVAHRYLGDSGVMKSPVYTAEDDYFAAVDGMDEDDISRLWMASAVKRSSHARPNVKAYDWMWDNAALLDSDMASEDAEPNAEDVLNFEKYIQRYVLPQLSAVEQQSDTWNVYNNDESDIDDADVYLNNDDEADVQLHSLLNSRPIETHPLFRHSQYYKKSLTSTTTMKPSTTSTATVAPLPLRVVHRQAGQKEEALLRPPVLPHPPTQPVQSVSDGEEILQKTEPTDKSIYQTIQRIINMHSQVQATGADSGRSKRFITAEDSLMKQLHGLNKVKV